MRPHHLAIIRIFLILTAMMLLPLRSPAVQGNGVGELLEEFERRPSATSANRFMQALRDEQFIDEPIRFSSSTPLDSMRQQVYYWGGEWLYGQQRYDDARAVALRVLPLFHPAADGRADCLNLLGIIYVRLGDFAGAANYAKQCLEMDVRSGDDDRISSSMNTVAGIYMAANQPMEAEKYIQGAIEHSERTGNRPRRAVILGMASEIYHKLGKDAVALRYAENAYAIDSLLGRQPQAAIRLSQKGYALIGLSRYAEAVEVFNRALPVLKEKGDRHSYGIVLNNMGTAQLRLGHPREAIQYYNEASGIFSEMGDLHNELHSHRGLYESYWEINPDSAKIEINRFNLLRDSLYSHSTAEALSRYNAEFGNDLLQIENSEIRREHRRTVAAGVALLVIVVAAAWLLVRHTRRRNSRRMQKLIAEIERLRSGRGGTGPEASMEAPAAMPEQTEEPDEDKLFLKRVIEAVNAAMDSGSVGVEQIASSLNMGEQSFRRRLQSAAGETPKALFTAIKMERASRLLTADRDMPISKVAELCGFENASSFGHAFKRMQGCTPSQYRRLEVKG